MLVYSPIPTDTVRALQSGGTDANGQIPERQISDGAGNPCRHCLTFIAKDAEMLVLAHRPFPHPQPYAEVGPIFLCAAPCNAPQEGTAWPQILADVPDVLIKGYGGDDRIVYGTGAIVASNTLRAAAKDILERPDVAYVHVRSARNNCYQLRVDQAK